MKVMQEQQVVPLLELLDRCYDAVAKTFTGSREGVVVVDVDEYLLARDLLLQFYRRYDEEVFRVCFDERLSNRPLCGGV